MIADSAVVSSGTGLGVLGVDRVADAAPAAVRLLPTSSLLALSTNSSIVRRLVDAIPEEVLSRGFRTRSKRSADLSPEWDERALTILRQAAPLARRWGGCYCLAITEDVMAPGDQATRAARFATELKPGASKLLRVIPLAGIEAIPYEWEVDLLSPWALGPRLLTVQIVRPNVAIGSLQVHRSRLIYLPGLSCDPTLTLAQPGYHLSVPDAYWNEVRRWELTQQANAQTAIEQSMLWLSLGPGAASSGSADEEDGVRARLDLFSESRSSRGIAATVQGDTLQRLDATLSGLGEINASLQAALCAVEGIPATRFFGQPPPGLATDDQAGERSWTAFEASLHRRYAEFLTEWRRLEFGEDAAATMETIWTPPVVPALEQATLSAQLATRDAALIAAGVITAEESRRRLEGEVEVVLPVLTADDEEEPLDEEVLDDLLTRAADAEEQYKLPEAARNAARRVLRWREEHGAEVRGMTEVGWRRARQLANNATVGRGTVSKMAAFNRHRKNAEVAPEFKDEPWRDAGHVAWLGWGGTTGIEWARGITGAAED